MKERFQNGIVADLLMVKNEDGKKKILLSKRKNTGYKDGEYELPGGHLKENEDLYEAMIREAKEELGISLNRQDLKIVHIMHHYTGKRMNFILEVEKLVKDAEKVAGPSQEQPRGLLQRLMRKLLGKR